MVESWPGAAEPEEACDARQVFERERKRLDERRAKARRPPVGDGADLSGLALSGGGVRSATFNLGLLQALAHRGALASFDYLSTVSGGGYIGSCVTSLCSEEHAGVTAGDFPLRYEGGDERAEVKHLRLHGNYLSVRRGPFSVYTWRLISTYLGGLVLTFGTTLAVMSVVAIGVVGGLTATWDIVEPDLGRWEGMRDHLSGGDRLKRNLTPALGALALWVILGGFYVVAALVPKLWSIHSRRWVTRVQGMLLLFATLACLNVVLPFLFVKVDSWWNSGHHLGAISGSAALPLLSFVVSRFLSADPTKRSGKLRQTLVVVGGWAAVLLFVFGVLWSIWHWWENYKTIGALAGLALVFIAPLVDINRVSMFYFYRDRLSEAFVMHRVKPDSEPELNDALRLSDLAKGDRGLRSPYHLVNSAVNLGGSKDLKHRGRKADFFLMSPLFCGSQVTGYAPTTVFEGDRGNVASAMAISGAATNPQYGRATNPALTFLMTLFNVRLGVWVENPSVRRKGSKLRRWATRHFTRFWPYYLFKELMGLTNERSRHINVSDGGHVENLGLYELFRRRCRVIVASDAGADPDCSFGDLAQALRLARIDLGVHVKGLDLDGLKPTGTPALSPRHVACGIIHYSKTPTEAAAEGVLVYVKSTLCAGDPPDLHEYRTVHPSFPHESTIDQFFDEGQFESYRELGCRCGLAAVEELEERKLLGLREEGPAAPVA